ncbi:hypothetical protein IHE45_08G042200 [Dioscorea alata]|uniref:Uncharacterized protein n=1 Tax=Dioscorea alata TaxID=55571 RepID=A0ACB7VIV4_DIOAL|nr:hypothetical protein IHE45_08G042200 [Dioscorea alata]
MGDLHIKSRRRTLKEQFKEHKEMSGESRFGWDEANQCVTCADHVHKDASGLRNKVFPYFGELAIIFGKDQISGDGAEFAGESVKVIERETSTLTAAKAASEAHESMKNMVQYNYFDVDVELEDMSEFIFISKNAYNDSLNGSYKRRKVPLYM